MIAVSAAEHRATHKAGRKLVVLGSATGTLKGGQSKTVSVALNDPGRRLLAQRCRLQAKLTIRQSRQIVFSRAVTFTANSPER